MTESLCEVSQARRRAVRDWILDKAFWLDSAEAVVVGLGQTLNTLGIQVDRITFHCRAIDPEAAAATVAWRLDRQTTSQRHGHGTQLSDIYLNSPLYLIDQGQDQVSIDLRLEDIPHFGIVDELREEGFTGYLALGCEFSGMGRKHIMTYATKHPDGFGPECIHLLREISDWISPALETRTLYQTGKTLMTTYLGRNTGARVLNGMIVRGTVEVIDSVIWMADLRGFTKLSQQFSPEVMVELLNDFFEAVITPVEDHGGEVLKLIGDGVLAIFPLTGTQCPIEQRHAARDAAFEAIAEIEELSTRWQNRLEGPLRAGIALHAGEVAYGNIGSHDRLDFTVIGEAVNLASRLCDQCATLDHSVLMSDNFVSDLEGDQAFTSLGSLPLKGFVEPQQIYATA